RQTSRSFLAATPSASSPPARPGLLVRIVDTAAARLTLPGRIIVRTSTSLGVVTELRQGGNPHHLDGGALAGPELERETRLVQQHTEAVDQHCTARLRDFEERGAQRVIHQIGDDLPGADARWGKGGIGPF